MIKKERCSIDDCSPVLQRSVLFRPEDPVAGIAKPGADVGTLIQASVQMTAVNINIRVCPGKAFQPLRRSDDAEEFDIMPSLSLYKIHGCDSGAAGRQHRIQNQNGSFADSLRKLTVIFMRLMGHRIPLKPHMANPC